jgi:hypothetical protein
MAKQPILDFVAGLVGIDFSKRELTVNDFRECFPPNQSKLWPFTRDGYAWALLDIAKVPLSSRLFVDPTLTSFFFLSKPPVFVDYTRSSFILSLLCKAN